MTGVQTCALPIYVNIPALNSNNSVYLQNTTVAAVEFDLPAGTKLKFWDSQGNTTYTTSEVTSAGSALVKFTSDVFSTLVGADVRIPAFDITANITAVNPLAYTFTLDQPATHVLPVNTNVSIYSKNTGVSYLTTATAIEVGQKTFQFTTSPDSQWIGPGNVNVSVSGIQVGTKIANTLGNTLILGTAANASIQIGRAHV